MVKEIESAKYQDRDTFLDTVRTEVNRNQGLVLQGAGQRRTAWAFDLVVAESYVFYGQIGVPQGRGNGHGALRT